MSELRLRESAGFDLGPWAITIILLASSLAFANSNAPSERVVHAFGGEVMFRLPAGWNASENPIGEDHVAFIAQLPTLHAVPPTVLVEPVEVEHEADALFHDLEVTRMQEARAESGVGYRVLHVEERDALPESSDDASLGGHRATFVWYAIVRDPPHVEPGAAVLPIVVVGVDALVVTESGKAWHVAAFEPAHESEDDEGHLRRIVDGLRIRP